MRSPFARASIAALLSVLTAVALAQVRVEVPSDAAWEAWIGSGEPGRAQNFKAIKKVISVPTFGSRPQDLLWVFDPGSGNVGSKPLDDLDGVWKVVPAELTRAAKVEVSVSHNGDPVAAANVILKSSGGSQKRLLTPSSQGIATFALVPIGEVEVAIETSKDGAPVAVPTQKFLLQARREKPVPTLRVAIGEPVDVVSGGNEDRPTAPPQGRATSSEAREEPRGTNFFAYFFTVAAIGGLGFLAWRFLPKYQKQIDAQLVKVGVQIPTDQGVAPDHAAVDTPAPPTRAPIQPIVLGPDAAPAPVAGMPVVGVTATQGLPKRWLNVATGEAVTLPEGVTLVTREAGSALSLPGSTAVSRRHAEVSVSGDSVRVRDLGSTNGSFLNNVKLMDEVEVSVGDIVQFGDVKFRLEAG